MARLLLVRHGQASYGEVDYDRLSSRGEEQARALGRFLAPQRLHALYVGPLRRQRDTVARATEVGALPDAQPVEAFAEYPAFDLVHKLMPKLVAEDAAFAALASTQPRARELADRAFHTILGRWSRDEWTADGVERIGEFVGRVRGALERVLATAPAKSRIAVVTSAGPIGVAVGLAFGLDAERMVRTSRVVRNASITELLFRTGDAIAWHPDRISVLGFNAVGHLPEELHTEY
jgi:broad specificity phosphatase PhoE